MKSLSEMLREEAVFLDLKAAEKMDAIREIIQGLAGNPQIKDLDRFQKDVMNREREVPTGLEKGAALPHARTDTVSDTIIAFGRSQKGIDFGGQDGEPARLIFLFGIPKHLVSEYLKMVAKLTRLLKRNDFREGLLTAQSPAEVIEVVRRV